jgi:hypothetical protein
MLDEAAQTIMPGCGPLLDFSLIPSASWRAFQHDDRQEMADRPHCLCPPTRFLADAMLGRKRICISTALSACAANDGP